MNAHTIQKLTPHRAAIRKLIKARYGHWFLLQLRSGKWQAVWESNLDNEGAIEAIVLEEGDDQDEQRFPSRVDALKFILREAENSFSRSSLALLEGRSEAMASLMALLDGDTSAELRDDFSGSVGERLLYNAWERRDQEVAKTKKEDSLSWQRNREVSEEQKRRDAVFRRLVSLYGDAFIDAINGAIREIWREVEPRQTHSRPNQEKAGELRPLPQLKVQRNKVCFISEGRAAPKYIDSPLSSLSHAGYEGPWLAPHWQHAEWINYVVPRLTELITEWECRANAADKLGPN